MTDKPWTFIQTASPNPLWRVWSLTRGHMTAIFTACKSRTGARPERHVTVTFESKTWSTISAPSYARAEKFRFMAQAHDTIGDITDEPLDLEIHDMPNQMATSTCTLEGDDALTVGAVYFGNEFAEAVL